MMMHIHTKEKKNTFEYLSLNYMSTRENWDIKKVIVDDVFAYMVDVDLVNGNKDFKPKIVEECQNINDWPNLKKKKIQEKLNFFGK